MRIDNDVKVKISREQIGTLIDGLKFLRDNPINEFGKNAPLELVSGDNRISFWLIDKIEKQSTFDEELDLIDGD